ncbi:MAG TPA: sigma factor-like helix-turn-helix DNA-binding protein [Nitrososphaeraceae archaeon]|nr:sigma factor-like helix-turn-helix DNA-binding protein [Nitrososphaeraceae archaeon]
MNLRDKQDLIQWRREKVLLLSSQGFSQREIASQINISVSTVNKDLSFLREQAKENIKKYVDEKIPQEYEKVLIGLNTILKESWLMSNNAIDKC